MLKNLGIFDLNKCYLGIVTDYIDEKDLIEFDNVNKYDFLELGELIILVSVFYKMDNEYFNFADGNVYNIGNDIDDILYIKPILEYTDDLSLYYDEKLGMDVIKINDLKVIEKFINEYKSQKKKIK